MPGTLISPPSASVVNGERHRAVQVVAVALEELVLAHEDDDVEIAGRTAERAGLRLRRSGAGAGPWRCPPGIFTVSLRICSMVPSPWHVGARLG